MAHCFQHVLKLIVLAALAAVCVAQQSQLGCFPLAKLGMYKAGVYRGNCLTICSMQRQPMWATDLRSCYCGARIPSVNLILDASDCQQSNTGAVVLNYINANSSRTCTLSPLPFSWDNWQDMPKVDASGVAVLQFGKPLGSDTGVTLYSWDAQQYGAYSVALHPSGRVGAVTALYLISDRSVPPIPNPWDEIDFEFVNYAKEGKVKGPHLWTNTFVNGTNYTEGPAGNGPNPKITTGFHTYLIDWQPNYIRWYMDGNLVKETNSTLQPMPVKPMYTGLSFWFPNIKICRFFGGCGDFGQLHETFAGDLQRVVCR